MDAIYDCEPLYDCSPMNIATNPILQNIATNPDTLLAAEVPNVSLEPVIPKTSLEASSNLNPLQLLTVPEEESCELGTIIIDSDGEANSQSLNSAMSNDGHIAFLAPSYNRIGSPVKKIQINSTFSLISMHDVFTRFDSQKRALLDSIGLGTLLKVQKQRLQCRALLLSLLCNMNHETGTIVLQTGALNWVDRDVNLVLGIPYTGEEVNLLSRSHCSMAELKAILLLDTEGDITMEHLQGILLRNYGRKMLKPEWGAIKVAAILFADSCFLGPRGCKRRINKDIVKHVINPSNICKTNWAGYMRRVLLQSAYKVQHSLMAGNKTVLLEGCLFFLLVFYLDNLNFGYMTPRHNVLPRIVKYTPGLVSELLSYDRINNGGNQTMVYGRSKIRPSNDVVYTRHSLPQSKQSAMRLKIQDQKQQSETDMHKQSSSVHTMNQDNTQPQVTDHFSTMEGRQTFIEYVQIFRNQIHEITNEFQRKVELLFEDFPVAEGISWDARKMNEQLVTPPILGLKARNRRYYMTVNTSSTSSTSNQITPGLCNIDMDNLSDENSLICPDAESSSCFKINCQLSYNGRGLTHHNIQKVHEFGPSPFLLELKHKDVPTKILLIVISVLSKLSSEEKNMPWFSHDVPSKLLIGGESLYLSLYKDADFSPAIMNGVMRLYHELDNEMYEGSSVLRWRHFLPAEWVTEVSKKDYLEKSSVWKHYFIGNHINYKLSNCSLVFLPVYIDSKWPLYAWDFYTTTITIMDPVTTNLDIISQKHDANISYLHDAMISCRQHLFGSSVFDNQIWDRKYLTNQDCSPCMEKSGLYCVFYAWYFDGEKLTRSMLMEDSVILFQTTLLCQLLGSVHNNSSYPEGIRCAIADIL